MPNPIAAGVSTDNNPSEFGTRNVGVESYNFTLIPNTVGTEKRYSTYRRRIGNRTQAFEWHQFE